MLDTILIIALLSILLCMLKEIFYNNRMPMIKLKDDEYRFDTYKLKEKIDITNCDKPYEYDNYNTIRQRKVRREIKSNKDEKKEKYKKKERKIKCKKEKEKKEVNAIRKEEFIISLDKEINTILAELILIKKNNKTIINRITPELSKMKIENANKLVKIIENTKVNDIDRIYVKKELLEEYIDILSNFINHTSTI